MHTSRPLRLDQAFDRVAGSYDLMVALNPGYHRHLRSAADVLVDEVSDGDLVLDLGCGSGASTRALLDAATSRGLRLRIIGIDASAGMLEQARAKQWPTKPGGCTVEFRQGRAETLTADTFGAPVAAILACYLLRNVPDLGACCESLHGLLAEGGALVIQEYSIRGNESATARWRRVNRTLILPLARLVAKEVALYRYLHRSVEEFCSIPELAATLQAAGFGGVRSRSVTGWQRGILHTVVASR